MDQLQELGICNFNLVASFCRGNGQHGGAAVYVRKDITSFERKSLQKLSDQGIFECAVMDCKIGDEKFIIASIYRPPSGNMDVFLEKIEQLLLNITTENKTIFLAGDFNINFNEESSNALDVLSIMCSFNLKRTIFENTRITNTGGSCIDNIFTNKEDYEACVLINHISDHTAQQVTIHIKKEIGYQNFKRTFREENKKQFADTLKEETWEEIYQIPTSDVNEQWNIFGNTFHRIFDQHFPLKPVYKTRKKTSIYKSKEITECKERLDTLLMLSRYNDQYKDIYRATKKEYDRLLVKEKANKYDARVKSSDNKMKCLWSICKETTGKNSPKDDCFIDQDPLVLANEFNNHLISVVPNILSSIRKVPFICNISENMSQCD